MKEHAYATCIEAGVAPSNGALGVTCAIEMVEKMFSKIKSLIK